MILNNKFLLGAYVLALMLLCQSCITSDQLGTSCRITKFRWENQKYLAKYNSSGRLILLEADTSKIVFYYDEYNKLNAAEIYFAGTPGVRHKYEYTHGPYGITQIDHYYLGEHQRELIHYASSLKINYTITQEFYHDSITFEIRHNFVFTEGDLTSIYSTSSYINSTYNAKFDSRSNPFRTLGSALGSRLFFPVGLFSFYPVSQFDVSYAARFSKNNPMYGEYQISASGLDPEEQIFDYVLDNGMIKKIHWTNSSYGVTSSKDYEFEYDCPETTQ